MDTKDVDVMMGTFTKSFGGMGGYVAGGWVGGVWAVCGVVGFIVEAMARFVLQKVERCVRWLLMKVWLPRVAQKGARWVGNSLDRVIQIATTWSLDWLLTVSK